MKSKIINNPIKKNIKANKKVAIIILTAVLVLLGTIVFTTTINPYLISEKYKNYLVNKYNFPNYSLKFKSYSKEYTTSNAFLNWGYFKAEYIPTRLEFETTDNKIIDVTDYKGHISDDYQIKDISYISAKYFSSLLGYDVKFVEFSGAISENTFANYIQQVNSDYINGSNVEAFLIKYGEYIEKSDNYEDKYDVLFGTKLTLYIKIGPNYNIDALIKSLNTKAMEFINKTKFIRFNVLFYSASDDQLPIISTQENGAKCIQTGQYDNYYVSSLDGIKLYAYNLSHAEPISEYDTYLKKIGNFYIDERNLFNKYSH